MIGPTMTSKQSAAILQRHNAAAARANPDTFAVIDPTTGLAPNETVCPVHNTTYHAPLDECPDCRDAAL